MKTNAQFCLCHSKHPSPESLMQREGAVHCRITERPQASSANPILGLIYLALAIVLVLLSPFTMKETKAHVSSPGRMESCTLDHMLTQATHLLHCAAAPESALLTSHH